MVGSFVNIIKDGALFAKGHKVEGFLIKLNREEGVLGKCAPSPSSRPQNRGGRAARQRRPGLAAWGSGVVGMRGERGREVQGVDSPLDFEEGGPQGRVSW